MNGRKSDNLLNSFARFLIVARCIYLLVAVYYDAGKVSANNLEEKFVPFASIWAIIQIDYLVSYYIAVSKK
jgi:hypothetical protein